MKTHRLITSMLVLFALSACATTPAQDSSGTTLGAVEDAPVIEMDGPPPEVSFDLLRPTAASANLLVSPNDLSNSAWLKGPSLSVQANAEPNLTRVSTTINTSYIGQRSGATAAGTYSARAFLKGSGERCRCTFSAPAVITRFTHARM
jgi:hypothetical protein